MAAFRKPYKRGLPQAVEVELGTFWVEDPVAERGVYLMMDLPDGSTAALILRPGEATSLAQQLLRRDQPSRAATPVQIDLKEQL
jgi:hypothetical protein